MSAFDTPKETSRALSIFTKTVTIGFALPFSFSEKSFTTRI